MTTTMGYGSWNSRVRSSSPTLRGEVEAALWNWPGIDVDAVEAEYRAAINAALPDSVSLCGDEFYGNAFAKDCVDQEGYPHDEYGSLDIAAIVNSIDFWAIVERLDGVDE